MYCTDNHSYTISSLVSFWVWALENIYKPLYLYVPIHMYVHSWSVEFTSTLQSFAHMNHAKSSSVYYTYTYIYASTCRYIGIIHKKIVFSEPESRHFSINCSKYTTGDDVFCPTRGLISMFRSYRVLLPTILTSTFLLFIIKYHWNENYIIPYVLDARRQ